MTALVAGLVAVPGAPAAAAPLPADPLPAEIDLPAFYEAQTLCDPTARPGTSKFADLLVDTYGPATIYIPRACTSSTSEHFDGRALDWMRSVRIADQRAMVKDFLGWLLAPSADGTPHEMARRLGVMYIIWNNRMIRMYDPARGWTDYRNCTDPANADPSLDTSCHRNHVHFSLSWDGAAGQTSWWTGTAQTLPSCSAQYTSATPRSGSVTVVSDPSAVPGLVPVDGTKILQTASGVGAGLREPCRIRAGRALYPHAAPAGVVPTDAEAVVLSVVSASNAPASLAVWSAGASRPAGQVRTPIGRTKATVVVPLGSDGAIGVSTSVGSAKVTARVIGYLEAAPGSTDDSTSDQETTQDEPVITRPSRPRDVTPRSRRGTGVVRTTWTAPLSDGGAPLLRYRVRVLEGDYRGAPKAGTCSRKPTRFACRVTGLEIRTEPYWVQVRARNEVGKRWSKRVPVVVR